MNRSTFLNYCVFLIKVLVFLLLLSAIFYVFVAVGVRFPKVLVFLFLLNAIFL
jgi:hypothetical protein